MLPYASELFGVYQPMIGWRSRRQLSRYQDSAADNKDGLLRRLAANYSGDASKVHLTLTIVLPRSAASRSVGRRGRP